jgi:hypothetical protein
MAKASCQSGAKRLGMSDLVHHMREAELTTYDHYLGLTKPHADGTHPTKNIAHSYENSRRKMLKKGSLLLQDSSTPHSAPRDSWNGPNSR